MARFDPQNQAWVGPAGRLHVREDDEITRKLLSKERLGRQYEDLPRRLRRQRCCPRTALGRHDEDLPRRLEAEGVDPHVPWPYGFQLDFRFK